MRYARCEVNTAPHHDIKRCQFAEGHTDILHSNSPVCTMFKLFGQLHYCSITIRFVVQKGASMNNRLAHLKTN